MWHLSLNFLPGNDADVKTYLATCLQTLRDDYTKLSRTADDSKQKLTQKLEATQENLTKKTLDVEKFKLDLDSQLERMQTKHMQVKNCIF